jgi:hypothetical protein
VALSIPGLPKCTSCKIEVNDWKTNIARERAMSSACTVRYTKWLTH